jgi:hypothetical protein
MIRPLARQVVKVFLRGPMRHQVRVGDQHARRIGVAFEDCHRLARLHQQVSSSSSSRSAQDGVKRFPTARCLPPPAVDDQVLRPFGHLRVEVVLDHAVHGFGQPGFAGDGSRLLFSF